MLLNVSLSTLFSKTKSISFDILLSKLDLSDWAFLKDINDLSSSSTFDISLINSSTSKSFLFNNWFTSSTKVFFIISSYATLLFGHKYLPVFIKVLQAHTDLFL